MMWQLWIIIGWFVLGALIAIGSVGKERKPVEPGEAVATVILSAIFIALIIWCSHA